MPRWIAAVGSGLASAVGAGVLFWVVNNSYRVNGVGVLQRQNWPINSPWAWAAAGFAVGTARGFIRASRRLAHARDARDLAGALGRGYAGSYSLPDGAGSLPVFGGWSDGRNAMTGTAGESPVDVFDFTTVVRGDESDKVTDGTAALLQVDGLPAFDLRPRTFGRRLLAWAGFEGLTFDPADDGAVRRFTQLFHLSAVDPVHLLGALSETGSPDVAGPEDATRRLFAPAVMAVANRYPGYAVQSRPGFLAVWRGAGVLPVGKRAELWDAAADLRAALTRTPDDGAVPVVPARAGTEASRQARRVRNTLAGGAAGLLVGFIVGMMSLPLVADRRVPGQGPGLDLLLLPVLFFGSALGGAVVGAVVGSRVPVRDRPPAPAEHPDERRRRVRATGCGVLVGSFAGFFGGATVVIGGTLLFGLKPGGGVGGAMSIGSTFGGALVGAVGCGLAVNRRYRRRQRSPSP